jgi:enamine deaminase RidA (YjgF/YER057c/UK114 family)
MDEEALNTSVRKFLKTFGVTAQREIEKAVRDAVAKGQLKDTARLPAKAVVTVGGVDLKFEIESEIELA